MRAQKNLHILGLSFFAMCVTKQTYKISVNFLVMQITSVVEILENW